MKTSTKIALTIILTTCLVSVAIAYLIGRPANIFIGGISGFCIGTVIGKIWER